MTARSEYAHDTVTKAPAPASPRAAGLVGVPALLSPVPCPAAPPDTTVPGVLAAGGICKDGRIVRITRLAHAAPASPTARWTPARCCRCGGSRGVTPKLVRPRNGSRMRQRRHIIARHTCSWRR